MNGTPALGDLEPVDDAGLPEALAPLGPSSLQVVPTQAAARVGDLGFAGRYVPAGPGDEPIAGDFYDVLPLGRDRIALVVGDVAGHGSTALARMQQLRAATRAVVALQPGPAGVIAQLDDWCERLDEESIATLWYGEYDRTSGRLTYCSAGHPPPALTCHGYAAHLLAIATAPPLGTGGGADAAEHHDDLPPGAILVAYSDGLIERPGLALDEGLARLQEVVTAAADPARAGSAEDVAAAIFEALVPDPSSAQDDVCLLVVRREMLGSDATARGGGAAAASRAGA